MLRLMRWNVPACAYMYIMARVKGAAGIATICRTCLLHSFSSWRK